MDNSINPNPEPQRTEVDGIPLLWLEPRADTAVPRRLAIWLPGFSGTREAVLPQLQELAAAGFVALSFDPYQHGGRTTESVDELVARIVGNIRRHFWPILARTAEDTLRVIDWAQENLNVQKEVCMGGISMGGDISVAAAGLDPRITRVAACIATPDWLRPGSFEPPGQPDSYAQYLYDRCNPLTNLGGYRHCPAISFQCGAEDGQVPAEAAARFIELLAPTYRDHPERLNLYLQPNTGHGFTDQMWRNSLQWFSAEENA